MSDPLNEQSAGGHALLVRFYWGEGQTAAYTTWSEPIVVPPDVTVTYQPEPRIEVTAGKQTGGVKDEPWTVTMPAPCAPLDLLARPSQFATVTCAIFELDPTAATQAVTLLWQGQVTIVTLNPKGKPGASGPRSPEPGCASSTRWAWRARRRAPARSATSGAA